MEAVSDLAELVKKVAGSVEECADALHDALLKGRSNDADDYARALSSASSAYRELCESVEVEEDDE